ncbi:hypothetical protein [Paludisphaera borealis]|nr:hypothetical protein [Paludisphaera borealis]
MVWERAVAVGMEPAAAACPRADPPAERGGDDGMVEEAPTMARPMNSTARDAESLRLWRSGMGYQDIAAYCGVGVFVAVQCVLRAMWLERRSDGPSRPKDAD